MADMHYRKTYSFGRKVRESAGRSGQEITGMAPCELPLHCAFLMHLARLFRRRGAVLAGDVNAPRLAHA